VGILQIWHAQFLKKKMYEVVVENYLAQWWQFGNKKMEWVLSLRMLCKNTFSFA
jgi:hypothetical protein